jgi:hypothetical protein
MDLTMTIVLYHHEYGTDAWLARREDAPASAVRVMLDPIGIGEMIGEDDETARPILQAVVEGRHMDALRIWEDATNESFEFLDVSVPQTDDGNDLATIASGLLADMGGDKPRKQYTVTWSYDCCVSSPEEAARLASEVMLTHGGKLGGSLHGGNRLFTVYDENNVEHDVELPDREVETGETP